MEKRKEQGGREDSVKRKDWIEGDEKHVQGKGAILKEENIE